MAGASLERKGIGGLTEERVAVEGNLLDVEDQMPEARGPAQDSEFVTRTMPLELVARSVEDEENVASNGMPLRLVDVSGKDPRMHETGFGSHGLHDVVMLARAP